MIAGASWFVISADLSALIAFVLPFLRADATLGLAGTLCVGLTRSAVPLLTNACTRVVVTPQFEFIVTRHNRVMLNVMPQSFTSYPANAEARRIKSEH